MCAFGVLVFHIVRACNLNIRVFVALSRRRRSIEEDDRPILVTEAGWQAPCSSMEELVIRNTVRCCVWVCECSAICCIVGSFNLNFLSLARPQFLNANQLFVDGNPEFTLIQADRDWYRGVNSFDAH